MSDPQISNKLINKVSERFVGDFAWHIYKSFVANEPLEKEFFYANIESLALIIPPSVERDMILIDVKEAAENGFIEYEEMSPIENAVDAIIFDLTDKGKEYIFPYVKRSLVDHFSFLVEYIESIDTTIEFEA